MRRNEASHWRRCAEEFRTRAKSLDEPEDQGRMLGVAETYDWLADKVEEREGERRLLWDLER